MKSRFTRQRIAIAVAGLLLGLAAPGGRAAVTLTGAWGTASSSAYQFNSFSFSADGGAVSQAQAVPEPGMWVLFALGLGLGAWLQCRRERKT